MQTLFNRPPSPERGIAIAASWNVTRAGLSRNLTQVINYYHSRSMAIKSNHLLVRLINTPALNYEQPVERFYDIIDAMAPRLAMSFEMTCPVFAGRVHDGVFYGTGTSEIIVGSSEGFDVHEASEHWKHQSPVRILSHDKTDLDMHVPNGIPYSQEKGLAVISVNIPLLFVMYRGFVQEQMQALRRGHQAKTNAQFIQTYVLPNAVHSHLDFALFNRALNIALKKPVAAGTSRKHPFAMSNWIPQTDRALKELTDYLTKKDMSIMDMLCTIPAVTALNGAQTMQLPSASPTYQYAWMELVARAKVLAGLAFLSPSRLLGHDKQHMQMVSRLITYDNFKSVIQRKLPAPHNSETVELLELIEATTRSS